MQVNYAERVKHFVSNDPGLLYINQIKGTSTYQKKVSKRNVRNGQTMRMSNNLLTLSCADLRLDELAEIISKLNSLCVSHKDVKGLNYFESCNILNSNAKLLACHFQYTELKYFLKKYC